ncbi:MAG: hypothetical protein JWR09_244 [Mucilaginibacter sp.]|nr:hypothetical protein [Mucilaginibacter sp.]
MPAFIIMQILLMICLLCSICVTMLIKSLLLISFWNCYVTLTVKGLIK